jgi:hypothetical protein
MRILFDVGFPWCRLLQTTTQWHDKCDCVCVPVFRDDDLPDINRELHEEWRRVTKVNLSRERRGANISSRRRKEVSDAIF